MNELEFKVIPWIGRTAKMLEYLHTRMLIDNGFDLTKEQWLLLKILSEHKGVSQNEIACITERDKTSLTRLVNTMERKTFLARIPSPDDKRINLLYLTKQGEKILADTKPLVLKYITDLQEGITDEEIETVIRVMKKIKANSPKINGC